MVDTRLTIRGDNRTQQAFRGVNEGLNGVSRNISEVTATAGRLAAVLGGALFVRAGTDALQFADRVQKLQQRLGGTTEFFSELRFVAEQTGVGFDTAATAIQRLNRRVAEAAAGTGEAQTALRALNIDAEQLASLPLDQQFEIIAEQLSQVGTAGERAAIAVKLFDTEGIALLQTVRDGAAGIQEYRAQARQLGLSLSQDAADGAAEANDAINRVSSSINGLVQTAAVNFAPAIEGIADGLGVIIPRVAQAAAAVFNSLRAAVAAALANITRGLALFADSAGRALEFFGADGVGASLRSGATALDGFADSLVKVGTEFAFSAAESAKLAIGFTEVENSANRAAGAVNNVSGAVNGAPIGLAGVSDEDDAEKEGEKVAKAVESRQDRIAGVIENALRAGGEEGAKGILNSILQQLASAALSQAASAIAGSLFSGGGQGGGGGFLSGLFGFAQGGSFRVGGGGGVDSQLVAFRASPNETVTISRPDQQIGGGGSFVFNVDARGATDPAQTQRAVQQAVLRSEKHIKDLQSRGRHGGGRR